MKNWYEIGEATIRVSVDFRGIDNADLEQGEVIIYPGDFLIGAVTNYDFTPYNTTIRVEDGQIFWRVENSTIMPYRDVRGDGEVQNIYDSANYYSNFEVANNNARADKLMRQLRRFAVEHREKELNWISDGYKHFIEFNYETNEIYTDWCCSLREFGAIFFDSEATAELAIETFRDELLWYFTEYEDSL